MTQTRSTPHWEWLRHTDVLMSVGVVGILMIMLLPLPRVVLDLLLAFNIALSIVVLLVGMQVRKPLEFSVFPSVLLMVTLFRLSLNIASTRLILLHGNEGPGAAGEVIRSFGNFVVGGNYTVGLVVFVILIVINFVVVTKGAGRVAEVAARFTLDAMPGKQMSIDADLNAGLINEAEARRRRREIAEEADFYGAMDGASKFVRGDAIAAVIIILVNIIGGLTIGVLQQGMNLAAAAANYTLLTIGEGLVAQVPALIVSTAAGVVVTRAATETNLGQEIARQVMISSKALAAAAGILLALGFVPGLPHVAFLTLGSIAGWAAYDMMKRERAELESALAPPPSPKVEEAGPRVLPVDLMEVQVGYGLIGLVEGREGGPLLDRIKGVRRQIAAELGFLVPPIHLRDNLQLRPNEYAVLLKGIEVTRSEVLPGHLLAIDPGTAQKNTVKGLPAKEPAFGLPALWIAEATREQAQMAGYTVVDPGSAIATHLSEIIKRHAHELLGRQEVQSLLDELSKTHPKVVEEVVPALVPLGALVRILCNLLQEGVPIRDLRTILEVVADYAPTTKDPEQLTEAVRQALARVITHLYITAEGALSVINLDPRLDRALVEQMSSGQAGYWSLEPSTSQRLLAGLKQAAERVAARGQQPVVLCSPALRRHLRRLTARVLQSVPVLALNEIDGMAKIVAMETIRLTEDGAGVG